jgi:hypothetical protein
VIERQSLGCRLENLLRTSEVSPGFGISDAAPSVTVIRVFLASLGMALRHVPAIALVSADNRECKAG